MNWLAPKLHLRVAQKQILTPGLVQMVSVLALNRLELREMINQEMVENPVLEELSDDPVVTEDYSAEAFLKAETEKVPEIEPPSPFAEFDVASFFNQYLGSGGGNEDRGEREVDERPSFEQFLSSAQGLSEHLTWQLSVTVCNDIVREIADAIIGNLDENGYLSASLEEISQNGKYSLEDVEEALAVVQEFDPLGVASRNLRECLLTQLRLSPVYRRLLARDAADRDVRNYVKERFTAALQLMKSIEQRKHTILRVCQIIIQRQHEYLDHGADQLKPMMIKEVAEEVGVHPSTVSRAVSSKYAHTPQGVVELR